MKHLLLCLALLGCAHKTVSDGGQASYEPLVYEQLGPQELVTYAQTVVKRDERHPEKLTLDDLRASQPGSIRRAALVVFETQLQPSRSGLATDRNVYLSPRGKQLTTEVLWRHWEQELKRTTHGRVDWVKRSELVNAKAFRSAGSQMPDHILGAKKGKLTDEDLFWRKPGERIPEVTLVSPANFQEVGILLIPAYEMMGGAKPASHQAHWVNDLARELKLDAVVLVHLSGEWRRGGVDKRTKAEIPEVMKLKLESAVLYPWHRYHQVGELKGQRDLPKTSVKLAAYESAVTLPVIISVPEAEETFSTALHNVLEPLTTHLARLSTLACERIATDVLATQGPR